MPESIGERLVESTGAKLLYPRLLNRLDEAFREAFLALLSGTVHLGEAGPLVGNPRQLLKSIFGSALSNASTIWYKRIQRVHSK